VHKHSWHLGQKLAPQVGHGNPPMRPWYPQEHLRSLDGRVTRSGSASPPWKVSMPHTSVTVRMA